MYGLFLEKSDITHWIYWISSWQKILLTVKVITFLLHLYTNGKCILLSTVPSKESKIWKKISHLKEKHLLANWTMWFYFWLVLNLVRTRKISRLVMVWFPDVKMWKVKFCQLPQGKLILFHSMDGDKLNW